jgi:outer membrane lipoprotein-sorting protein
MGTVKDGPVTSRRIAVVLLGLVLLPGCRGGERKWPFPEVESGSGDVIIARLAERTDGVRSLYAVLSMSFESKEQSAVVEAVVHYAWPGRIRMTAFKDTLVSSRDVFDLVLTPQRYFMILEGEDGPERHSGPARELSQRLPGFRAFEVLREALFLPGLLTGDDAGAIVRSDTALHVRTLTPSGLDVRWQLDKKTLGVEQAQVAISQDFITVIYVDYREVDGRFFPETFELRDPGAGVWVRGVLQDLEINLEIPDEIFSAPMD